MSHSACFYLHMNIPGDTGVLTRVFARILGMEGREERLEVASDILDASR